MIIGTGIDLLELSRLQGNSEKNDRLAKRILTDAEYTRYKNLTNQRKIEFLAGRFAAKEAFSKAYGTGIGKKLSWKDITILNDENGKPVIHTQVTQNQTHLSISHSKFHVIASVIIESLSS